MDEVNQITFFRSYFESVENLDAETYKECMNVILKYIFRGEEPDKLSPTAKMFWTLTKPSIDKSLHKRNNVKDGNQTEDKSDSNQSQTEIKSKSNESQTEDKPDSNQSQNAVPPRNKELGIRNKEQDIKNSPAPSASPSALEREFEATWAIYPRKQERKDALAAYCRARKRGTTAEQIDKGVRAYCAYIERNHVDPQYVKQGGTFFRQQAWADDWTGSFQTARSGTPGSGSGKEFPQRTDDLDALALQLQFAASQ